MNKTIRNKALKVNEELYISNYLGDKWYTPDGHFSIKYNIYEGYKLKKHQQIPIITPRLEPHLNRYLINEYVVANNIEIDEIVYINDIYAVSKKYYDLAVDIYPNATIKISTNNKYSPVLFYDNNKLVGLIMPLKV